jgi:DNA primase
METEEISFVDAVKKLASRTGVEIPAPDHRGSAHAASGERETLFKLNQRAMEYFQSTFNNPETGKQARDYIQSRQFDQEIIEKYQIGWATPGWRDLKTHLEKTTRCSPEIIEKAGLIKQKEGGGDYYDRFRDRVVLPLKDRQGRVIGFGGRIISGDGPKYLNSPETAIYKKSNTLFGFDGAREAIRKRDSALIMEGYFDQIRSHQYGIRNAVATCGTALTSAQVTQLRQQTANAILVFDADPAGQAAAQKGFDILLEQGMNVKTVVLPQGQDPDSYILNEGPEAFLQQIETAKPFVESYIENAIASGNKASPEGRMALVNQVLPLLAKIKNNIERSEWLKFFSERAGVEDKSLLNELKKALEQKQSVVASPASPANIKQSPELYLIHLMLSDEKVREQVHSQIELEELENPHIRSIVELVFDNLEKKEAIQIDRLLDSIEHRETRALLTKIGLEPILFDDQPRAVSDCIREIKRKNIESKIKELKKQRGEAEKAGEAERSRAIHVRLREMKHSLTAG